MAAYAGADYVCAGRIFHPHYGGCAGAFRAAEPGRDVAVGRSVVAFSFLLLVIAMEVYLGRFERLLEDHTIFGGVTYTDAHVTLTGMLMVARRWWWVRRLRRSMRCGCREGAGWWRRLFLRRFVICRARDALVCGQFYGEAERTGSREALHRVQYRVDAAGIWTG